MDNIYFPQDLIYRQREKLDEFDIENKKSLNYILESELFKLYRTWPGYKDFAINILNTAYYVCTMALADEDPMRSFGDYLQRVKEIMQEDKDKTALALSMVLIIIDAHEWKGTKSGINNLALQIFYEIEKNDFIRYSFYEQAKNHYNFRADRTTLTPDSEFVRRPINYRLLADNYSVEELRDLFGTDEDKVFDFIFTLGKDEEEQYTIASFLEDQMHSFFADGWRRKAFFDYIKSGIHKKFHGEEERAIEDAEFERQQEEDAINDILIQEAKERIPQLEAENARLRAELERKNKETAEEPKPNTLEPSNSDTAQLQSCIKELQNALTEEKVKNAKLEEEIAELLGPVEDLTASQNVRLEFALQLLRAAGMDDKILDSKNRKKATVARLLMLLTDIRSNNARHITWHSCEKYLTDRRYLTADNKELIIKINRICVELGVNATLDL